MYSSGDYGTDIPMPQSTSKLAKLTRIPTGFSQWQRSCICGIKLIRISTVRNSTINIKFSPFVISVDGMLGREALAVLADLSRIMAAEIDEPISHV